MRVAHILKTTGLSGAESHLLTLSGGLLAEGWESRLIVLVNQRRPPTALIEAARAANVQIDTVPLAGDLDMAATAKIAALLKSAQAQIVHTHMIHGDLYGTLAARMAGIAVVQTRHNDDKFRRRWPVRLLARWLAGQAKTVIAISDSLATFARDVEGVPGPKIVRIHYGLDPVQVTAKACPGALRAELGLNDDVPLIGAVGRLTEQKGFRYLLEAFAIVRRSLPQAQLVIAGDGELRSTLEAQGHKDAVRFLGWRSDVPSVMADIDVLAVPSLWEGFGLVTLEAMALSKPVVASRVSALPEIVASGETGLLVPPADPKALAGALCALLTPKAPARAMGARGRVRLQIDFSVQRMVRQHVAVYKEAASRVPEFRA
ncbi:MAG: glycosyltransferase [Chloroflexota bacterium]